MFSGDCAFRQFFPLSRFRLQLRVNRDDAVETVYHDNIFTLNLVY